MRGHTVRTLPSDSGRSGWEAISPRYTPVRELDRNLAADWLVIGAGFAGLSAARRLNQLGPGEKIVVLDARELAQGASGANSGFMIDVPHNLSSDNYSVGDEASSRREIRRNRLAIDFAAGAAAEYGMPTATFDACGKINAAASRRGLGINAQLAASLQDIGESHEMLDASHMREITGSDYYHGGIYTPGAVLIQPADYIRRLAAGLDGRISLFENSPVVELRRKGGVWKAMSRRGGVQAPKVILAVNGHVESFGHFRGRLMHVFTYASMTAAFPQKEYGPQVTGNDKWALLPADPMGATLRKTDSDGFARITIRSHFTYEGRIRVSGKRIQKIAARQRRRLDARFPALARIPMEFSWAGPLCLSRNHAPAFGELEPGLYSACCENGLGTVKSTLAGMMAAELATTTHSAALDDYLDQPQPNRLPPEPLTWLGANSVIRWHELRAGREK